VSRSGRRGNGANVGVSARRSWARMSARAGARLRPRWGRARPRACSRRQAQSSPALVLAVASLARALRGTSVLEARVDAARLVESLLGRNTLISLDGRSSNIPQPPRATAPCKRPSPLTSWSSSRPVADPAPPYLPHRWQAKSIAAGSHKPTTTFMNTGGQGN
jgi:hypothetical protein